MHFFFVFHILVTALILVQCQEYQYWEGDEPHAYTEIQNCSMQLRRIRENMMNTVLKPRERLVLLRPKPGYEFKPATVSVKRCTGRCAARWSPIPTRTEIKEFIVQLGRKGNIGFDKCASVHVEEHTACRCKCTKTANDCNSEKKEWIPLACACSCLQRASRKSACERQWGMVWDDENCECQCAEQIMDCESGFKWNPQICNCTIN